MKFNKRSSKIFSLLILAVVLLMPSEVWAQTNFINCNGPDCSFCNLVYTGNYFINWLIGILFVLAGIIAAVAGIKLVTSGGNVAAKESAKNLFVNAVIGLILVFAAWLIIDTIMKMLVGNNSDLGPWNAVECSSQNTPVAYDPDGGYNPNQPPPPIQDPTGGTTQPTGNLVSYAGYQYDEAVVDNVQYLAENYNLSVTSGYRDPQHNASVGGSATSYHLTGRAADFVGSSADMEAARQWANANGAKEALIHNAGSGVHLHVAW